MGLCWMLKAAVCVVMVSLAFCSACGCTPGPGSLRSVWAVDDGEKIFRGNVNSPLKTGEGNSVWDGKSVRLFSARNEIVAFQLILEAGGEGASEVNATVSALSNGSAKIRGSRPLPKPNEYAGVGVELFTEHYLHVETPSYNDPARGGYNWSAKANPKLTGWIPDALIPFSATRGRGGAPFDIGPNANQGVWVDIYVPREGCPAGRYEGIIEVTVEGEQVKSIPLSLEVMDFALPDETHYRSMVYYSDENIAARHGVSGRQLWDMVLKYHQMAHRHRIELIGNGSWEELEELKGTLTGNAFSESAGYAGPGEGVGNTLFCVNTYEVRFPDSEEAYRRESDRWVEWFEKNAPKVEYFLYLTDEPRREKFDWVKERAKWIHDNPGPGGRLPVFLTTAPRESLIGAIDMWCAPAGWVKKRGYEEALARGERYWVYAAYRPRTPGDVFDEYGIAWRLKPWIAHKHGIARWFTWESSHWQPNENEKPNDRPKEMFTHPVSYTCGTPQSTGNGDGTLFYPGQDRVFPDQDRGYPGPMSSIRMKMYRRGIQDIEYMWLAEQKGGGEQVKAILRECLPATMWDAEELPSWSNSNAVYEQARRKLADLVLRK